MAMMMAGIVVHVEGAGDNLAVGDLLIEPFERGIGIVFGEFGKEILLGPEQGVFAAGDRVAKAFEGCEWICFA